VTLLTDEILQDLVM